MKDILRAWSEWQTAVSRLEERHAMACAELQSRLSVYREHVSPALLELSAMVSRVQVAVPSFSPSPGSIERLNAAFQIPQGLNGEACWEHVIGFGSRKLGIAVNEFMRLTPAEACSRIEACA